MCAHGWTGCGQVCRRGCRRLGRQVKGSLSTDLYAGSSDLAHREMARTARDALERDDFAAAAILTRAGTENAGIVSMSVNRLAQFGEIHA